MTLLRSVITEPAPGAPKGIIYGPPMAGKSTFGGSADDSLLIDCENGAGAIPCRRTPYVNRFPPLGFCFLRRDEKSFKAPFPQTSITWRAFADALFLLKKKQQNRLAASQNVRLMSVMRSARGATQNGKRKGQR